MMISSSHPKGKTLSDPWKQGQRVPAEGFWVDQWGNVTHHKAGRTFPGSVDSAHQKGECCWRWYLGTSPRTP